MESTQDGLIDVIVLHFFYFFIFIDCFLFSRSLGLLLAVNHLQMLFGVDQMIAY